MNTTGCIFGEPWWLDAAAPDAWETVSVTRDNGVLAEMSFMRRRRNGLTFIEMPPLTRTLSPRLDLTAARAVYRNLDAVALVELLAGRLPRHDRLELRLAPACPSLQGFVHAGFAATHTFTYRSAPGAGPADMLALAHKKTRNQVVSGLRTLAVARSEDVERFLRLHHLAFAGQSLVDRAIVARVLEAALRRGQAKIIFASTDAGVDVAAAALVFDAAHVYLWLSARLPEVQAGGVLVHEALAFAHEHGLVLDLDGYGTASSGLFLMKFGLTPQVRPVINRSGRLWRTLRTLSLFMNPRRPDEAFRV